eukprot:403376710
MDFKERFKGRTDFVNKQGIQDVVSNVQNPIKPVQNSLSPLSLNALMRKKTDISKLDSGRASLDQSYMAPSIVKGGSDIDNKVQMRIPPLIGLGRNEGKITQLNTSKNMKNLINTPYEDNLVSKSDFKMPIIQKVSSSQNLSIPRNKEKNQAQEGNQVKVPILEKKNSISIFQEISLTNNLDKHMNSKNANSTLNKSTNDLQSAIQEVQMPSIQSRFKGTIQTKSRRYMNIQNINNENGINIPLDLLSQSQNLNLSKSPVFKSQLSQQLPMGQKNSHHSSTNNLFSKKVQGQLYQDMNHDITKQLNQQYEELEVDSPFGKLKTQQSQTQLQKTKNDSSQQNFAIRQSGVMLTSRKAMRHLHKQQELLTQELIKGQKSLANNSLIAQSTQILPQKQELTPKLQQKISPLIEQSQEPLNLNSIKKSRGLFQDRKTSQQTTSLNKSSNPTGKLQLQKAVDLFKTPQLEAKFQDNEFSDRKTTPARSLPSQGNHKNEGQIRSKNSSEVKQFQMIETPSFETKEEKQKKHHQRFRDHLKKLISMKDDEETRNFSSPSENNNNDKGSFFNIQKQSKINQISRPFLSEKKTQPKTSQSSQQQTQIMASLNQNISLPKINQSQIISNLEQSQQNQSAQQTNVMNGGTSQKSFYQSFQDQKRQQQVLQSIIKTRINQIQRPNFSQNAIANANGEAQLQQESSIKQNE